MNRDINATEKHIPISSRKNICTQYPLDKDLHTLYMHKLPTNPKIYPVLNIFMELFKCKSDNEVTVTTQQIPSYQGELLNVYVIEPQNKGTLPCLVYFHGGGFLLKASGSHYRIAKEYAKLLPCKVIYVDYRLAPKHPFPAPVEDCFATYKWVLNCSNMLNINPDKIIVGGDSAGGNLATAVTLMAKDRGFRLPNALCLIYPVTDRRMTTESMQEYTDTPVWNAPLSKMMWDAYLAGQTPEHMAYASPIETASFSGFPPTYIEVAEYDCLRDEGILLYERLQDEGIPCELHEIQNACHGYETIVNSAITRNCLNQRTEWLSSIINTSTN